MGSAASARSSSRLLGGGVRVWRNAFATGAHVDPAHESKRWCVSVEPCPVCRPGAGLLHHSSSHCIQATSLVAVVGAASLAIGLALQAILSNMAASVILLLFRPVRLGESIEVASRSGTVMNLNLFMTELASGDRVLVLIPNGQV